MGKDEKRMVLLFCFLAGSCIGSFVNVLVWRLPRHMNFVTARSICTTCHHQLAWYDLIPFISWVMVRGKCRYCHASIPLHYPLVELAGGLCAMLCNVRCVGIAETLAAFSFFMILLAIARIDGETMIIRNDLLIALCVPLTALLYMDQESDVIQHVLGAGIVSGFMLVMNRIKKDCFGGGDIKLMFLCGGLLGVERIVLAMITAVLLAGGKALYLLRRKKATRCSYMALGPYLTFGIALAYGHGTEMLAWYCSFFM